MTDPRYQHDIIIVDHSGSMETIRDGMQSGFEEFIDGQQKLITAGTLSRVTGSLWEFDDVITCVYSVRPVSELRPYTLIPRGMTALCDATAQALIAEGGKLAAMPEGERPGQVVAIVVSDGRENASKEFTPAAVAELKKRQEEEYNWRFAFLGCGTQVFAEGMKMGMGTGQSLNFTRTSSSAGTSWSVTSAAVGRYTMDANLAFAAGTAAPDITYSSEERQQASQA